MKKIEISAYDLAMRYVGTKEVAGASSSPIVLAMLQLDQAWPQDDEVAWCSAFINWVTWHLRLPRSKSLRARSWLAVGTPVATNAAEVGFDIVVLKRGAGKQPGPEVINAPGHVGFFAGYDADKVILLGGNQANAVNIAPFPMKDILGIRRLA